MADEEIQGDQVDQAQNNQIIKDEDIPNPEDQINLQIPEEILIERTKEKIKKGLKKIGKTSNGEGYAFVHLKCDNQNIKALYNILPAYTHLRQIFLQDNDISDISSLSKIKFLTHLDLSSNQIDNLSVFNLPNTFEFLEDLNLQKNNITKLEPINLKSLKILNLNKNSIVTSEEFQGHPTIQILELRKNKLLNCKGLKNMFQLTKLYLEENTIDSIEHLEGLPQLKHLFLKQNAKLEEFKGQMPQLPYLHELNLSETKIKSIKEIEKLIVYQTSLQNLNVSGIQDEQGTEFVKKDIIMRLPCLQVINDEEVTQDEKEEAQRQKEEDEKARLEAEEERKRLALENEGKQVEVEEEQ